MKYIKKDFGSYKLHMIKTDKFKTIKIRVCFRNKIEKHEITMRNILSDILVQSSKDYPTKRDLVIKSQDLYAANISSDNTRYGNYINTDIFLNVLEDKFTEDGNYKKAVEFLRDIIYNPNVSNNKFDEETLSIIKDNAKTSLEGLKEDSNYYSVLRLYEAMDKKSPLSYRMCGYIEDIEKINSSNLYNYYKKMIEKDLMDIFVIGDIDFKKTEQLIKDNFKLRTFKKQRIGYQLEDKKARSRKLIARETIENSQSKLTIGCRIHKLKSYEIKYPLTLYSIILGSGTDSKLFKEVREKHSLCYTIGSIPNKLDNVLLIRAGVDKKNVKKTVALCEEQMNLMRKGKFTDKDISIAKEFFNTALDSLYESENSLIDCYYMMEILGIDEIETRRKMMNKVTKEEIIKVAKKIKMDTVYCLEGIKE